MTNSDNQASMPVDHRAIGNRGELRALFWLLFWFAPIALYISGSIVILLFAAVLICLLGGRDWRAGINLNRDQPEQWWLLLLLVYGLLSVGWARDSQASFYDWWRIALILSSGWLLVRCLSRLTTPQCLYLLQGVMLGVVGLVILLAVEWLSGGQLGGLIKNRDTSNLLFTSRACALLAVLIWPVALYCRHGRGTIAAGLLLFLVLILIAVLPMLAASIAVLVAGAVFLCHRAWPRFIPGLLGAVFIAALLAAPWAGLQSSQYLQPEEHSQVLERLPSSWLHRLVIWNFFARRIQASPWLGYGLGSGHGLSEVPAARQDYQRIARRMGTARMVAQPPLHPHNAPLQLWHDLGLAGVLGVSAWLLFAIRALSRNNTGRNTVAACLASLTAWLVISALSFGLWQKWWLASGAICLTVCLLLVRGLTEKGPDASA